MKVAAYIPLHYGKDYLPYAIRAIIDQVDKLIILYTDRPSYGHGTQKRCPENRPELRDIAGQEAGNKLQWVNVVHSYREGDHRNRAFDYCRGYDILAAIDADEVWEPETFQTALEYVRSASHRNIGVHHQGWYHFWRSFNEYNTDGFCPIRFHNLRHHLVSEDINCPGTIYHFGYAQKREIMEYKWSIHGHQDELRPDYLNQIYFGYKKGETKKLHPSSLQIWEETKDFDRHKLPEFMHSHPFFNLDKIE